MGCSTLSPLPLPVKTNPVSVPHHPLHAGLILPAQPVHAASRPPDMKPDLKQELAKIRAGIDALDQKAVKLLNARLKLAQKIGELKRGARTRIYVAEREADVLRRVQAANKGPLKPAALQAVYREIMSAAIALEKPLVIAYLGPEATNSHQAALKKFGASVGYHAFATFADIFTAVEKGEADYGVVPIENSTEGSVRD